VAWPKNAHWAEYVWSCLDFISIVFTAKMNLMTLHQIKAS